MELDAQASGFAAEFSLQSTIRVLQERENLAEKVADFVKSNGGSCTFDEVRAFIQSDSEFQATYDYLPGQSHRYKLQALAKVNGLNLRLQVQGTTVHVSEDPDTSGGTLAANDDQGSDGNDDQAEATRQHHQRRSKADGGRGAWADIEPSDGEDEAWDGAADGGDPCESADPWTSTERSEYVHREVRNQSTRAVCLMHVKQGLSDFDVFGMRLAEKGTHFKEIDFSQNQLTANGLGCVLDLCRECPNLRVLKLFKNRIGDDGVDKLASVIAQSHSLREVHLSHNRLTEAGICRLVELVSKSRGDGLRPLWLRVERNWVGKEAEPRLLAHLMSQFRVCPRRQDCTVDTCSTRCSIHLPFLDDKELVCFWSKKKNKAAWVSQENWSGNWTLVEDDWAAEDWPQQASDEWNGAWYADDHENWDSWAPAAAAEQQTWNWDAGDDYEADEPASSSSSNSRIAAGGKIGWEGDGLPTSSPQSSLKTSKAASGNKITFAPDVAAKPQSNTGSGWHSSAATRAQSASATMQQQSNHQVGGSSGSHSDYQWTKNGGWGSSQAASSSNHRAASTSAAGWDRYGSASTPTWKQQQDAYSAKWRNQQAASMRGELQSEKNSGAHWSAWQGNAPAAPSARCSWQDWNGGNTWASPGAANTSAPARTRAVSKDTQGRDYDLKKCVVNFANVGAQYARVVLDQIKTDKDYHAPFDWEGVRRCVSHLKSDLGMEVIGCVYENFTGPDNGSPCPGVPDDIRHSCTYIQEVPRLTGPHHKSADDEVTIKSAFRRNCRFLDNDNYRDWLQGMKNANIREWFQKSQNLLQMKYYFDGELGTFDTLDGNIDYCRLAP
mmetsp:Transcript_12239/g.28538  ORF Transcript_12239/g.28538 Transcript_12239/m.28538 type:complete len:836 (+) Transcript_12239:70-2577(+)